MKEEIKNLLVSFSGGETSAFMAKWLKEHYKKFGYQNIVFVFANTGLENEETLKFVDSCDKHFELNIKWVEAKIIHQYKKGTRFYETSFKDAKRNGEPFEDMIRKYGIPNQANPQCTRELKGAPIKAFGDQWFSGKKYHTAIGIRIDEIDRISVKAKKMGFIYPLTRKDMIPCNKPMINLFWRGMPFRLNLKGFEGNCETCWKKSDKKLYQIAKNKPSSFDFMINMEKKYGNFFPPQRIAKFISEGKDVPKNITFFRNNRSAMQIIKESATWDGKIKDDSRQYDYQLDLLNDESCEIWSQCGEDN